MRFAAHDLALDGRARRKRANVILCLRETDQANAKDKREK
jgi:hypothetical protein